MICPACQKPCEPIIEDCGIGYYEYGSIRSYDECLIVVSDCCNADLPGMSVPDMMEAKELHCHEPDF